MNFAHYSEYLQKLENTSSRLEMIDILSKLVEKLDKEEIRNAMYLTSGYLKAPYESVKFNIADKMMFRVLSEAYSSKENQYSTKDIEDLFKTDGDLGDTAYKLCEKKQGEDLTIKEVHTSLLEIANAEGSGSQEAKVSKLSKLLKKMDKLSAKYTVRIVLGTTRLGFTETTIIEGLAKFLGDRKLKKQIEGNYNIHPDIGLVAEIIKTKGLDGLKDLNIEPGIPVLSQKCQRVGGFMDETMERIQNVWAEYKFDGTRVQLHIDRNKHVKSNDNVQFDIFGSDEDEFMIRTYTRNLEETTHQYPDIVTAAKDQIDADSIILDGEAIGFDEITTSFLPFQETIQRKRKHDVKEMASEIPLKYYIFDILYLNGNSLINAPLAKRRDKLKKVVKPGKVIEIAEHIETTDIDELTKYYEEAKGKGLEGLIAKNPEDLYQAGARSYSWIKLKNADEKLLDDAVECVVLGYYAGEGVRSNFGIGKFLVGIYDEENDVFKTITKVGTGLKDDDWIKIKKLADAVAVKEKPSNVLIDKIFTPDVYTKPEIVVEIGADEISKSSSHIAGYSLRFPRLLRFRPDKPAYESTTLQEIEDMFKHQRTAKRNG